MRLIIACCVLVVALAAPPKRGEYEGHQLLRLVPQNEQQLKWLENVQEQSGLDFWMPASHIYQEVLVRVEPHDIQEFLQTASENGLRSTITIGNLQDLVDAEAEAIAAARRKRDADFQVDAYAKSAEIFSWMDRLATTHSRVMSVTNIGKSYEGRALKVAKVSSGGSGKPAMFINSGMHSREWIAHASVIWILNEMVTKYGSDPEITALVDKFDWYLMPLANPDGYDYSHDTKRLWRKTRSPGARGCYGTDPNRNWDIGFGGAGTSRDPCNDAYPGTHAFSEPETAALAKFLTSMKDSLLMYMDLHAFSQLWMTNYGYKANTRPTDASEVDRVANIGAKAIEKVNGNHFRVGTPPQLIYAASGGAFDWTKAELGVKYCYALELRPDGGGFFGFFVSPDEIPASGRETLAGIAAAANAMQLP